MTSLRSGGGLGEGEPAPPPREQGRDAHASCRQAVPRKVASTCFNIIYTLYTGNPVLYTLRPWRTTMRLMCVVTRRARPLTTAHLFNSPSRRLLVSTTDSNVAASDKFNTRWPPQEDSSVAPMEMKQAVGGAILAGIVGVAACLCVRQVTRYYWKLEQIEERRALLQRSPRPLQDLASDSSGLAPSVEFTRVSCEGVFDHPRQVLLGPRSAPASTSTLAQGKVPAGAPAQSGWDVITPLVLADGTRVLVSRGWVARDATDAIEQPAGTQRLEGVLKHGERENRWGHNDVASGRYLWLDLPTIAAATDCQAVLVVAAAAPAGSKGPCTTAPQARPLEAFMAFHVEPSRHMSYAATWGALTVAGTFMTRHFLKRR